VSLDFQVLGPIPNAPDDVEVLIAASRKEKVEDRMAVAQAAGLKPVVVDVESYAMRSALQRLIQQLPNHGDGLVIAVFYMGANSTSVTVMHDGEAIYEREQPFGGQQLTGDIARTYGVPADEAEQKKRSGDLPANFETDVLKPFVDSAVTEITRALQFFFTSTPYTRIDQIMLAGGSAVLAGLADALMERAQVPTSVISPFKGMEISANIREKQLRLDAPALLTPCGLAMRRFDE
jgi:type IV pilus assembly protein PilM